MPNTIYIPENDDTTASSSSGIDVTWIPSSGILRIGGWFDHIAGIGSQSFTLREFFTKLSITEKDIKKAMKGGPR